MAIEVTINLDSGCFLPVKKRKNGYCYEVGYFQNPEGVPDIKVFVDGFERMFDPPLKLGCTNCTMKVRVRDGDGAIKRDGANAAPTFHQQLLHLKDLYSEHIEMDRAKFDCVFQFEMGRFLPSMIKARSFKRIRKAKDGSFAPTDERKEDLPPICHNAIVHFDLKRGETVELVVDGKVLLSSKDLKVKSRLAIEVPVENSVANKFYHDGFKVARPDNCYWLPNDGDPPPSCGFPPCGDGGTT